MICSSESWHECYAGMCVEVVHVDACVCVCVCVCRIQLLFLRCILDGTCLCGESARKVQAAQTEAVPQ